MGVEADVEGGDGLAVFGRECLGGGVGVDPVGAVVADGAAGVAEGEEVDVAIDAETVGEAVGDHRHKPHVQLAEGVGGLEEDGAGGAGVVLGLLGVAPPKAVDGVKLHGHGEGTEIETALPHEESCSGGHQGAVGYLQGLPLFDIVIVVAVGVGVLLVGEEEGDTCLEGG